MKRHYALLATCCLSAASCIPGGVIDKGGHSDHAGIIPQATRTHGAPYKLVCYDATEAKRRENLPEDGEKPAGPPVRYENPTDYRGGCEEEGESSIFFLFNMFPVTAQLDPEYAIAMAVQRLEGDTMIGIRSWHETHYYSILGRVSVFKVKGRVIKFLSQEDQDQSKLPKNEKEMKTPAKPGKP
ncbi:MAG: hypothetical protein K8S54_06570 [Spirochaetia bacterium]|nr:hypothetical protein [Spirochaetia bacterium]